MTQKPTITLGDRGQNIELERVLTFCAPLEMSDMIIYITYEGMDKELEIYFSDDGEYQDGILKLTDARDAYLAEFMGKAQEKPSCIFTFPNGRDIDLFTVYAIEKTKELVGREPKVFSVEAAISLQAEYFWESFEFSSMEDAEDFRQAWRDYKNSL